MEKMLTEDQEFALKGILKFIETPINEYRDCATILYAAAGCGKTFLTRYIADKLKGKYTIAGVAPTHKARKVLDKFLNNNFKSISFGNIKNNKIKTMTVAALLGKLREHSYIGTKNYKATSSKVGLFQLFIIDEASMINNEDIKTIISYAFQYKVKLIFVGDKYQIPNPVQEYICENEFAYKADSIVFNIPGFELTTNIRQRGNNSIVPIYWELRNSIMKRKEPNINRENKMENGIGVQFYTKKEDWYEKMTEVYSSYSSSKALHQIRTIAYTNDAVKFHNTNIRKILSRGEDPEVGELLMGYNNVGFPEPYISNGQDYYILSVHKTETHAILTFRKLVGLIIKTKEVDTNISATLFIPDIENEYNQEMLQELVKRAEKVNLKYSTKADYKKYFELRNKLIFMENIYKFQTEILGETQFRLSNPLLFKGISDVINYDKKEILNNKLVNDIEEKYGNIIQERIEDNKFFSDVEKLCDKYCIIEKDIDYGYCITSHKSQGSTYQTVFIDEADFDKLKDHYNYKLGCQVKAVKEKNQLKYVSYTRPTDSAYVFYVDIIE